MEKFDTLDAEILAQRQELFNAIEGPRVGDFLLTADGYLRFTHDWGDAIQTTVHPGHPCNSDASFYLSKNGHVSFSGSLDPSIDKSNLIETEEKQEGCFWFFHHDFWGAGRGVNFRISCRVFKLIDRNEPTYENQLWHA